MRPPFRSAAFVLDLDPELESESPSRRAILRGGDADPSNKASVVEALSAVKPFDVIGRSSRVITSDIVIDRYFWKFNSDQSGMDRITVNEILPFSL